MALPAPLGLAEKDKLQVLQRLDHFRTWRSLDEKRYCLVCSKIITGEQVRVIGDTSGNEPLRVICPTNGCHSIPMDWVRPTDEVLAKTMLAAERCDVPAQHLQHPAPKFDRIAMAQICALFKRSVRRLIPLLSVRSGGVDCSFSSAKITRRLT
jgi:hypothetical protein